MELESLIRSYVKLGKRTGKGFEQCICASCNDYKLRGGFKFDGDVIGYHCFNCGLDTKFDPSEYKTPSEKFRGLLGSFGIPEDEISKAVGKAFIARQGQTTVKGVSDKPVWSPPKTVEPPPGNVLSVMSDDSPWCEIARLYLTERALDPAAYPYMVSDHKDLIGRVIIPYTHRDRLIYWQGRALDDTMEPRYKNPTVDKEKLIFNYDEISNGNGNLYVTEGAIDALSIGPAVALSDSHVSEWKFVELRKAAERGRKIIFVIDKNKVGYDLGQAALKEGWSVVVMPDGIDDANRCRIKFGRLWLLNHLASSHVSGVAGEVLLRMKCDRKDSNRKKRTHER